MFLSVQVSCYKLSCVYMFEKGFILFLMVSGYKWNFTLHFFFFTLSTSKHLLPGFLASFLGKRPASLTVSSSVDERSFLSGSP